MCKRQREGVGDEWRFSIGGEGRNFTSTAVLEEKNSKTENVSERYRIIQGGESYRPLIPGHKQTLCFIPVVCCDKQTYDKGIR